MAKEQTILRLMFKKHASANGISQKGVARQLELSPSSFSQKLSGKRDITLPEAHRMATLLGVSLDTFWELLIF